jgi:hypothetical protein
VENKGFLALKASQNVGFTKIIRVLFIDKTNVLPGHVGAFDRRKCARA